MLRAPGVSEESVTRFDLHKCKFDLCTCKIKELFFFVIINNGFLSHLIGQAHV